MLFRFGIVYGEMREFCDRRIGERRELIKRWDGYEGDWRATIAFDGELFILRMGDGRINSELKPFRNDVTEIGE